MCCGLTFTVRYVNSMLWQFDIKCNEISFEPQKTEVHLMSFSSLYTNITEFVIIISQLCLVEEMMVSSGNECV